MQFKSIIYVLGRILYAVCALLLLPTLCAVIYKESLLPFVASALVCLALGFLFTFKNKKHQALFAKDGFLCVGLAWIVVSLVGCLPYIISGAIPSFINAFFETVSGFTTTGASILSDIEALPKSLLLWRSLTQWIGGMGVLVFLLAVTPKSENKQSRYMHLMRAEVPGPTVDKIVPRLADTARVMYGLYISLTFLEIIFLIFGEMNLFEAVNHSLTTASTGGFGIKNDSITSYSAYSQYVISAFMLVFGINFNVFYLIVIGQVVKAFKNEELRWYFILVAFAVGLISINLFYNLYGTFSFEYSFRHALFQVASIISTTGFSTIDFGVWPVFAHAVLVLLMFCGACAGSTAGGIKISRLLLLTKNGRREVKYLSHPRAVISVKLNGKPVDHETIRGTTSFIIMYTVIFVASFLFVTAFDGVDLVTGFTSVATSINNVGPGLSEVGPSNNFAFYSNASKLVLCFDMLAGRLELFPFLMLLSPASYRKHA